MILNYLSFKECITLYMKKLKFCSPSVALCDIWLKLAQWFWRRSRKCEKSTEGQTLYKKWSEKLTLSLQLRWAKKVNTILWTVAHLFDILYCILCEHINPDNAQTISLQFDIESDFLADDWSMLQQAEVCSSIWCYILS